jgi:hypothetical protein
VQPLRRGTHRWRAVVALLLGAAACTITVDVEETRVQVLDQHGTILTVVPRTNSREVTLYGAYRHTGCRA